MKRTVLGLALSFCCVAAAFAAEPIPTVIMVGGNEHGAVAVIKDTIARKGDTVIYVNLIVPKDPIKISDKTLSYLVTATEGNCRSFQTRSFQTIGYRLGVSGKQLEWPEDKKWDQTVPDTPERDALVYACSGKTEYGEVDSIESFVKVTQSVLNR